MMPSFFIAHGAPSIVLEENAYTSFLKDFAATMTTMPKAIVLFSAHWETSVQTISGADTYSTIYDFSGFQEELYRMTYPAKGDRPLSKKIQSLFEANEIHTVIDEERGLDHGAWAVLKLIYPAADIPVIALSVNRNLTNEQQYQIGKVLLALRDDDILIIGSGGTVHNLRRLNWETEGIDEWAQTFDEWLQNKVEAWDLDSLFNYRELAPFATEAVPSNEHFIPLFLAMGAGDNNRQAELKFREYQYGNLSLSCWQFL